MSDNALTVNAQGYVFWDGVRLPMRKIGDSYEFMIKHPHDQRRLGRKRVKVPIDKFGDPEHKPRLAHKRRRPTGRMPRVSPRNKSVDKTD